jgi:AraC-like DNA-binding protein
MFLYVFKSIAPTLLLYLFLIFQFHAYTQPTIYIHEKDSLINLLETQQGKEKLETYKHLIQISYSNPDTALRLKIINNFIEEAKRQKNIEKEIYARMQLMDYYYYYNVKAFNANYDNFMDDAKNNKQWEGYFYIFSLKIAMLSKNRQTEQAIVETEQLYNFAKRTHNIFGLGMTTYVLGKIYLERNRFAEAETYFNQSIEYFKKNASTVDLIVTYKALLTALKEQKKYKEIEQLMLKWTNLREIRDKELGFKELAGYFYLDMEYTELYINLKQFDKAKLYMEKISSYLNELSPLYNERYKNTLMELYYAENNFSKALAIADTIYNYQKSMNNTKAMLEIIYKKALILGKMGNGEEASILFEQFVETKDSVDEQIVNAKLDELRMQYDIDKLTLEKKRAKLLFIIISIVVVLLVFLIVFLIIYYNRISLKNKSIVAQIIEKDKILDVLSEKQEFSIPLHANIHDELFEKIEKILDEKKLYTKENLDRKLLAKELNTNEEYVRETIKRCSGKTFTDYINMWRLRHARTLLSQENRDKLEVIAMKSGFKSRSTLYRLFYQKYSLSPSEYCKFLNNR